MGFRVLGLRVLGFGVLGYQPPETLPLLIWAAFHEFLSGRVYEFRV